MKGSCLFLKWATGDLFIFILFELKASRGVNVCLTEFSKTENIIEKNKLNINMRWFAD